jgi:hypothetical protein
MPSIALLSDIHSNVHALRAVLREVDACLIEEIVFCAVLVGSVGQPRTSDTRAAWTIWDSDAHTFEFRRTEYPSGQAASDIREAGLPESSARRLVVGS